MSDIIETPVIEPEPALTSRSGFRSALELLLPLAAVGGALFAFDWFSATSVRAHRGIASQHPPIYGYFRPSFTRWGAFALAAALVAAVLAFALTRLPSIKARVALPILCSLLLSFGASLAIVNGDPVEFVGVLTHTQLAFGDYQRDVPVVQKLGIRGFIEQHPKLVRAHTLRSVHSRTHPPGPGAVLALLQSASPKHLVPRALVLAFLSSLILIPTWFLTRRFAGERAALFAVLLMAVAPAPGVFIFLSFDAIFALLLAASAALLVWGLPPDGNPRTALIGGALLGLTSIMTYAVLFVAGFVALYALFTKPRKDAFRALLYAGAGGILALLFLRVALGYDVIASYRASYAVVPVTKRDHLYWIFGNPAVWLTFAGVPIAALALKQLVFKRPVWLLALFAPLIVADVTWIFPGETERIGQFAAPFLAAAAGAALVHWETRSGRKRPLVLAILVLFTALQAIALEALFWTAF